LRDCGLDQGGSVDNPCRPDESRQQATILAGPCGHTRVIITEQRWQATETLRLEPN